MRALQTPPRDVVGPGGVVQSGSYRGALPKVDLSPLGRSRLYRITHHKRWVYVAIAAQDLFVGLALVDLGYVLNTFAFAYDHRARRMLADRSALGHPAAGSVNDTVGPGLAATFQMGRTSVAVRRPEGIITVDAHYEGLEIHAHLDTGVAHAPLSAIGPIPDGVVDATEKHALLPVRGHVKVGGERRALEGAVGGYDYTHGYLARHTRWRWGYLLGRAKSGEPVGLNLVEGFLGELECGVWVGDQLHPVGEGRFDFDMANPEAPWRVTTTCGAVDLRFVPGAIHRETTNLGVVRSRFYQPVGAYQGTIEVAGRRIELEDALGVAEDQDVLW